MPMNPEKKVVMICDLCDGEPKCVDSCPEEALELGTEDDAVPLTISLEKAAMRFLESFFRGCWKAILRNDSNF